MSSPTIQNDLQVEITNRQILKIALPISLALLVPQINFITNNVFLSGLGEAELGTAGITGVFYLIFAIIGNGLNSGLQALLARRAGEKRPEEIGKLFGQSVWIGLLFALTGIIIMHFFGAYFLEKSLKSATVEITAINFLKIRVWGLPFLYLFQLGNAFLVGSNNSRYMKYAFFIEALLNIFLDYTLIYGHWGFPKLGFNGAAYASIFAEIVAVLIVFGIIMIKKFHIRFGLFKHFNFDRNFSLLIFKKSSPLVLQWLLSIGSWLLFYILIENKGERELAISNTMRNIFGLFGIFVWAFASTSNAMVSNVIGQGKKDKVIFLIKKISKLSFAFTFILCLIINLYPGFFFSVYGRGDSFIKDTIPVIRVVTGGMLIMSFATVWLNAVTGTGKTKMNLIIEIITICLYSTYIILALKIWNLSLVWAWGSEIIYWTSLFILSYLFILKGNWKDEVF